MRISSRRLTSSLLLNLLLARRVSPSPPSGGEGWGEIDTTAPRMIITLTDFGVGSPYLAQMRAALRMAGVDCEIIDLVADLAPGNIQAAAHFLATQPRWFPPNSIFLCVVDPGVGGTRPVMALQTAGQWFVGPDNGLFDLVAARADHCRRYHVGWRPESISVSFHGRDLFAPVAAALYQQRLNGLDLTTVASPFNLTGTAIELPEVIYQDTYGNLFTGLLAEHYGGEDRFTICGETLSYCRVFLEAEGDRPFWYENSVGLIEIAINGGSAANQLGATVGTPVHCIT